VVEIDVRTDICYRIATGMDRLPWLGPINENAVNEYDLHLKCLDCDGFDTACKGYKSINSPEFGK